MLNKLHAPLDDDNSTNDDINTATVTTQVKDCGESWLYLNSLGDLKISMILVLPVGNDGDSFA
jgi:hypothetical protein